MLIVIYLVVIFWQELLSSMFSIHGLLNLVIPWQELINPRCLLMTDHTVNGKYNNFNQ